MPPSPSSVNISTGTHGGLTLAVFGMGGVYRDEMSGPPEDPPRAFDGGAPAVGTPEGRSPGLVPFGVTRLPALRLGGATRRRG